MALTRFKSKGGVHLTGRVQPTLQDETTSHKVTPSGQWLCQSSQKQLSEGGFVLPVIEKGIEKGRGSILTSFLQPVVSSPKTPEPVETNFRPKHLKRVPESGQLRKGNASIVNLTKSELTPQVFNFVGYCFDLSLGLVKLVERWSTLNQKI